MWALNINSALIVCRYFTDKIASIYKRACMCCRESYSLQCSCTPTHNIGLLMLTNMASTRCVIYRQTFSPPRICSNRWLDCHFHLFSDLLVVPSSMQVKLTEDWTFQASERMYQRSLLKSYDVWPDENLPVHKSDNSLKTNCSSSLIDTTYTLLLFIHSFIQ